MEGVSLLSSRKYPKAYVTGSVGRRGFSVSHLIVHGKYWDWTGGFCVYSLVNPVPREQDEVVHAYVLLQPYLGLVLICLRKWDGVSIS